MPKELEKQSMKKGDGKHMMEKIKEIIEIIESVQQEVCESLCQYGSTADEDRICDYIREHGACPLDRIS